MTKLFRGSNSSFRAKVAARDKGICANCLLDTLALAQSYRDAAEKDKERSGGTYACLRCEHVGMSKPCEECGGRLLKSVDCHDHRAEVVREATRHGFKALAFIRLMQQNQSLWVADHRVPLAAGGDDTLENGRTLCVPCNHRTTGDQTRERNRAKARERKPTNVARNILRTMRGRK